MIKATGTFLIEYVFDSESLEGIEAQNQGVHATCAYYHNNAMMIVGCSCQ